MHSRTLYFPKLDNNLGVYKGFISFERVSHMINCQGAGDKYIYSINYT